MVDHQEARKITAKQMALVNRRVRSMQRLYDTLAHKMNNLSRTPRTQPMFDEFNTINLQGLVTLEQCDVVQEVIDRLLHLADTVLALNPYLVDIHSRSTRRKNLGDIQLDQNGTTIRLSDFFTIRGTTRAAREETVKRLLNDWLYEANESLNRKVQFAEMNLASIRKSKLKLPGTAFLRLLAILGFVGLVGALLLLSRYTPWRLGSIAGNDAYITGTLYLAVIAVGLACLTYEHARNFPLQFTKSYERELSAAKRAKEMLLSRREKLERLLLRKARSGGRVNESLRLFTIASPNHSSDAKARAYLFQESTFYKKHYGFGLFIVNLLVLLSLAATGYLAYLYFLPA